MLIENKDGKQLEVTDKAYRVVYKDLGYKPFEEPKEPENDGIEPEEKPISEMTIAELKEKAAEINVTLESTKVVEMREELTQAIEEIKEIEALDNEG